VLEHPVFVSVVEPNGERRLPVPDKKAIVNGTTSRVLGIVSRGYRLVTNREALDMAHECCREAFPLTQPGEWQVSVTTPLIVAAIVTSSLCTTQRHLISASYPRQNARTLLVR